MDSAKIKSAKNFPIHSLLQDLDFNYSVLKNISPSITLIPKFDYQLSAIINKRPKGPNIVHLSTMTCHLFDRSARATISVYTHRPEKNTN